MRAAGTRITETLLAPGPDAGRVYLYECHDLPPRIEIRLR